MKIIIPSRTFLRIFIKSTEALHVFILVPVQFAGNSPVQERLINGRFSAGPDRFRNFLPIPALKRIKELFADEVLKNIREAFQTIYEYLNKNSETFHIVLKDMSILELHKVMLISNES